MSTETPDPVPDGSEPGDADARVVRLGLLADNVAAEGPRPTLMEIQAWHMGRLTESRAAEVKSHVARDPLCFAMWSEVLAAERTLAPELPDPAAPNR